MEQNIKFQTKKYDLEERVTLFSENLITFCKILSITTISKPLIDQLIRCGTSIGANYMEANACSSRRDFINKVNIARKESKETLYWLRLLSIQFPERKDKLGILWKETHEISLILGGILKSAKSKL
ncbi:MAG: four helix bundle protein [Candidatus Roizmanbacteria bacterium]|nr:four helix bundle protein [Candidatus Roizmanbacteria bacterium]MCX6732969.1 four helix bundle protein [Candidatus Roizmanbacteria bacterium]